MPFTLANAIADLRDTYENVPDSQAEALGNEVDVLIQRVFRQRQEWRQIAVTAYVESIDLNEDILWIRQARYVSKPNAAPNQGRPGTLLEEVFEDELDTDRQDYSSDKPGTPTLYFQTHDSAQGQIGLSVPPNDTTLTVSAATTASPIVVTSSAAHGLSDGDRVDIYDAAGNTAANGEHYAKVTGYSTTTFALYSDSDLATAVAGNGAYTTGGLISCVGSPLLMLKVCYHATLTSASNLPETPMLRSLYSEGMKFLWAKRRHKDDIPIYKATFEDVLSEQDNLTNRRAGFKHRRIRILSQRETPYVTRTRW